MSKTNILRRVTVAVMLCAAVVVTSTTTNFPKQLTKQADAALTMTALTYEVQKIMVGEKHVCFRDNGGQVSCSGDNTYGQLGDGTNNDRLYAKAIKTSHLAQMALANAFYMAGGANHTCMVSAPNATPASAVYCWGDNQYGQLGNGTNTNSNQPTLVNDFGGFTNTGVADVYAGGDSTCALKSGQLWCWGRNDQGQLGNGSTLNKDVPTAVSSPFNTTNTVLGGAAVTIGGSHMCATSTSGSYALYCWGDNLYGQLGNNSNTDSSTPVDTGITNTQGRYGASAGAFSTCARNLNDNVVKCWGRNNKGQLGDGTTVDKKIPTTVSNAGSFTNGTGSTALFGGGNTMCMHNSTKVFCWGDNSTDQIPGAASGNVTAPAAIQANASFSNSQSLGNAAAGVSASTTNGFVCFSRWCWGANTDGQLSNNTTTANAAPAPLQTGTVSADSVGAPTIVSATFSGNKIVIKLSGLISGAQISILPSVPEKDPNSMNQMVIGNTVTPTITNGEATVEMQTYSIVTAPNWMSPVNYTVDSTKKYWVRVSQSGQTGANANYPDGFQSPTSAEAAVTGGSSSTSSSGSSTPTTAAPATTTTVPKASTSATTNVVPGVTVTDTKVYVEAPAKVASASAIDVLTPAQAKTSDIVSRTPSVCLPNDEDLVFIDEGRCIAQVVNEKTRKVLRTLKTTVVADEVSELKVGNEIAVLSPLYFTAGTSTMKASSLRRLNSLIPQVKAAGSILVAGHSGVLMGDTAENRALSRERANTVVAALKKRGAKADFAIAAVGALDPVSTGSSQADQDKNRRAVIVLIP